MLSRLLAAAAVASAVAVSGCEDPAGPAPSGGAPQAPAQHTAGEPDAMEALARVYFAQTAYRDRDLDGDGTADYADSLQALGEAGLLRPEQLKGGADTYAVTVTGIPNEDGTTYGWTARAKAPARDGLRHFWIDDSGILRFADAFEALSAECTAICGVDDDPKLAAQAERINAPPAEGADR